MHPLVYLAIFILKLLENALGTIRMLISINGKQVLSAILQFLISIVWVASASLAITNIASDPLKVIVFALASMVGSYVGCIITNKIEKTKNTLFCITDEIKVLDTLNDLGYTYTTILGSSIKSYCYIILIVTTKKSKKNVIKNIKDIDNNAMIISGLSDTVGGSII
jgi:uncharacterized protein YebE (UPF0316 family)